MRRAKPGVLSPPPRVCPTHPLRKINPKLMFAVSRLLDESLNRDGQHKVHRYNRLDSPGKLNSQVNRMRRSETVGITEVQAMLRLVAETAELWYDPIVQRRYTLESLCRVLPAKAGICFTFGDILMGGDAACGPVVQAGMDESQERLVKTYLATGVPADPALPKLAEIVAPVVVARRSELVNDKTWHFSPYYTELREPLGLDDTLYAKITVPGKVISLALLRSIGEEAFTERQSQLVDLCLSQMTWPFQPDDKPVDPRLASLQPRLRKVMQHLLDGDGEKQVAAKLGLSRHTVHEYVKMLYQQLGVSSRSELLSQWVGRV